jgi:hypothetical protein
MLAAVTVLVGSIATKSILLFSATRRAARRQRSAADWLTTSRNNHVARLQTVAAALAQSEYHKIVAIARETGLDLLDGSGLEGALAGEEVVIDATQSPSLDEVESTGFFTTDAKNLGGLATCAGVTRTAVLSIVGVDRSPDYGNYVAKLAQENAHRSSSPGTFMLFQPATVCWVRSA